MYPLGEIIIYDTNDVYTCIYCSKIILNQIMHRLIRSLLKADSNIVKYIWREVCVNNRYVLKVKSDLYKN